MEYRLFFKKFDVIYVNKKYHINYVIKSILLEIRTTIRNVRRLLLPLRYIDFEVL